MHLWQNTIKGVIGRRSSAATTNTTTSTASRASACSSNSTQQELSRILHQVSRYQDNDEAAQALLRVARAAVPEGDEDDSGDSERSSEDSEHWEDDARWQEGRGGREAMHATTLYLAVYQTTCHNGTKRFALASESVYTAALVMPQIARSSGYCLTFTAQAANSVALSILTMVLQYYICGAIHRASISLAHMTGKPNLCTYGTEFTSPDVPRGPFGVVFDSMLNNLEPSHSRAYRTNVLFTALQRLGQDELANLIGPVDIGIQSPSCRLVCMGIFCVAVLSELRHCWSALLFLWFSPTTTSKDRAGRGAQSSKDSWIAFREDRHDSRKAIEHLHAVTFQMNGMPYGWKAWCWLNCSFHSALIIFIGYLGSRLLLATGAILELILNSTALAFVLEMDFIAYKAFVRAMTHDIMERLEPFQLKPDHLVTRIRRLREEQYSYNVTSFLLSMVGQCQHLLLVILLVTVYYVGYLLWNCDLIQWPLQSHPIFPWTAGYYNDSHSSLGGFDFWMGRWVSKNITWGGEVTCAPWRPDRPTVTGCGLPEAWSPNR